MLELNRKFWLLLKSIIYFIFFLELNKIRKFKNTHKGEKVYIVADSAEIRFFDFKNFDDAPMICYNFSWLVNDIISRKSPLYAHIIEPYGFTRFSILNKHTRQYLKKRIYTGNIVFFTSLTNLFSLKSKNVYYLFKRLPLTEISVNLQNYSRNFMTTSTLTAISLAIYMGFSKIQLIGLSTHSNSYKEHWYSKNLTEAQDAVTKLENDSESDYYFTYFKKFIEIETITLTSVNQSYFNYNTYYNCVLQLPQYYENYEMTDLFFLELMHKNKIYPKEVIF